MSTETPLYPVVWWLTQEQTGSHEERLFWILDHFEKSAIRSIVRRNDPNDQPRDAKSHVYLTLNLLQELIVGQYLPQLSQSTVRGINCIWPWWSRTGIQVVLRNGEVDVLSPPFPDHEEKQARRFKDNEQYVFTFYRSDLADQRHQWFHYILREQVGKVASKDRKNEEFVDDMPEGKDRDKEMEDDVLLSRLRAIVDSADYLAAIDESSNLTSAERQARHRAKRRVYTAASILERASSDPRARAVLDRLKNSPDGQRQGILNQYVQVYLARGAA